MSEAGLTPAGRLVSLDEVLQGETYLDPLGPTRQDWRDGDSSWALVEEGEMASVMAYKPRLRRHHTNVARHRRALAYVWLARHVHPGLQTTFSTTSNT